MYLSSNLLNHFPRFYKVYIENFLGYILDMSKNNVHLQNEEPLWIPYLAIETILNYGIHIVTLGAEPVDGSNVSLPHR